MRQSQPDPHRAQLLVAFPRIPGIADDAFRTDFASGTQSCTRACARGWTPGTSTGHRLLVIVGFCRGWRCQRRTNENKRKGVLGTLALRPEWSDRAVAKHVGVGHPFVATVRRSLESDSGEQSGERTYTTKHGTTATMDTSGQKAADKGMKTDRAIAKHFAVKHPFVAAVRSRKWPDSGRRPDRNRTAGW